MGQAKQGGSILGYVIVGGVLTLLLLAGAYALRNYWSGNPAGDAAEVARDAGERAEEAKPETGTTDDNAPAPQPSPQPAAPAAPSAPAPSATPAPATTQLPQTGPADTVLSVAILAIMAVTLGVYLQSRRLDASL